MFADIIEGVTILDLTQIYNGPRATRMLSDYGARVIKIENYKGGVLFSSLRNLLFAPLLLVIIIWQK